MWLIFFIGFVVLLIISTVLFRKWLFKRNPKDIELYDRFLKELESLGYSVEKGKNYKQTSYIYADDTLIRCEVIPARASYATKSDFAGTFYERGSVVVYIPKPYSEHNSRELETIIRILKRV